MEYTKPFLTFEEQARLLVDDRGLEADKNVLIKRLQNVGYYRLSGYWHIYKKRDNSEMFWEGTTFDQIWNIYVFDRQFRLLVLDAIERVEIYMRTQLAYHLTETTDKFGFLKPENLPRFNRKQYEGFIGKCEAAYERATSGEAFAKHFKKKYGDKHRLPPYWILVNMIDFGAVVSLYKGASVDVRKTVASELRITPPILDSWLVTLNTVRNICAHHGRLWNRIIGTPPKIPKETQWHDPFDVKNEKIVGALTVLSYLLEHVAPTSQWRNHALGMIGGLSVRNQSRMGFTDNWKKCPFWQPLPIRNT